jgi:hypothetical protein
LTTVPNTSKEEEKKIFATVFNLVVTQPLPTPPAVDTAAAGTTTTSPRRPRRGNLHTTTTRNEPPNPARRRSDPSPSSLAPHHHPPAPSDDHASNRFGSRSRSAHDEVETDKGVREVLHGERDQAHHGRLCAQWREFGLESDEGEEEGPEMDCRL